MDLNRLLRVTLKIFVCQIMPNKRQRYVGKPLATRSGRGLFPTLYVDLSPRRCGPRALPETLIADMTYPMHESAMVRIKDPFIFNPDQAALAAIQWGGTSSQPEDKPWIKSWYFPTDAFEQWPTAATGLRCWHCTHKFDWPPFPMPRSFDKTAGRFRVIAGGFCGPSCAKAYAKYASCVFNDQNVFAMIDQIAFQYFGYKTPKGHIPVIPIAPKKEVLQKYCGPKGLTITQFRTLCAHGRRLTLADPGFISQKQIIEAEDITARRKDFNGLGRVFHAENPDDMKPIEDMVRVRRPVFGGRGARPLSEFFKSNTHRPKIKKD